MTIEEKREQNRVKNLEWRKNNREKYIMTQDIISLLDKKKIDYSWSFSDKTRKDTAYITHGYHRYPAKFIPQIVSRLAEKTNIRPRRENASSKPPMLKQDHFLAIILECCLVHPNFQASSSIGDIRLF